MTILNGETIRLYSEDRVQPPGVVTDISRISRIEPEGTQFCIFWRPVVLAFFAQQLPELGGFETRSLAVAKEQELLEQLAKEYPSKWRSMLSAFDTIT